MNENIKARLTNHSDYAWVIDKDKPIGLLLTMPANLGVVEYEHPDETDGGPLPLNLSGDEQ